jgi:hypothetical protein
VLRHVHELVREGLAPGSLGQEDVAPDRERLRVDRRCRGVCGSPGVRDDVAEIGAGRMLDAGLERRIDALVRAATIGAERKRACRRVRLRPVRARSALAPGGRSVAGRCSSPRRLAIAQAWPAARHRDVTCQVRREKEKKSE